MINVPEQLPVSKKDWKPIAQFLGVPDTPKGLYGVLSGFLAISAVTGFESFPYQTTSHLKSSCLSILRAIEQSPEPVRSNLKPVNKNFKKALHGVLTRAPLYSLLYFSLDGAPGATLRRLKQAGIVMWHSEFWTGPVERRQALYQFQLAIRSIVESRLGRQWLAETSAIELASLLSVRAWFVEMEGNILYRARYMEGVEPHERRLGKALSRHAHSAVLSIDAALGRKEERASGGRSQQSRIRRRPWSVRGPQELGSQQWLDRYVPEGGDLVNKIPAIYSVHRRVDDPQLLEELDILDADPSEFEDSEEVVFTESDTLPLYVQEYRNRMRLRGMAQRIETHVQYLPHSLEQFSQGELLKLFEFLDDRSSDQSEGIEKLVVLAMLATGSWFERALNLEVVSSDADLVRGEQELLYFNQDTETWLIPALVPEYRTPTDELAEIESREIRADFIELPDYFQFAGLLKRTRIVEGSPGLLFRKRKNLKTRCKRCLKSISPRHTLERIERCLVYKAAGMAEPVQASSLFATPLKSGHARAFYTSMSHSFYTNLYQRVCEDLFDLLGKKLNSANAVMNGNDRFVGARYCPSGSSQQHLVSCLSSEVERWRERLGVLPNAWVEFHNWFTINSCVVLSCLIGTRGIRDPMLSPAHVNALGVATFRDKDSSDQFHTRSIQLAPRAMASIQAYAQHRRRVLPRLALLNHESFISLSARNAPWAFLLNYNGQFSEVRPATLQPYLSQISNLPFNSTRKFLRTRLLELNVSPVAIDSLLGHCSYGEQSWGHFSSMDWCAIYREQRRGLDEIVDELNLRITPGLAS